MGARQERPVKAVVAGQTVTTLRVLCSQITSCGNLSPKSGHPSKEAGLAHPAGQAHNSVVTLHQHKTDSCGLAAGRHLTRPTGVCEREPAGGAVHVAKLSARPWLLWPRAKA